MRIIAVVTQKGGAGKTTVALNLAVAAAVKQRRVLVLDLDPQRTALSWYEQREAITPAVLGIPADAAMLLIPEALARARSEGTQTSTFGTMDEKKEFAGRLRAAMIDAGHGARPSVLEANFNSRFGQRAAQGGRELAGTIPSSLNNHDRAAVEAFLALPATHRKLAREMIAGLAQLSQQARS